MKKILIVLFVLLTAVLLVSCEGDIFSTLSNFMGKTKTNILTESGLATVDTAAVEEVSSTVQTIASLEEPADDASDEEKAEYEAAYDEAVETAKETIPEILASPQKKEDFVEQMSEPLPETFTPPPKIEDALTTIQEELEITVNLETEGDLLAAMLLVDVYEDATPLIEDLEDDDPTNDPTDEELLAIASDALQVIQIVKEVSSVADIDIDAAVSELLDTFLGSPSTGVRDLTEEQQEDIMEYAVPIARVIIDAMDGNHNGEVEPDELELMQKNYALIRTTFEKTKLAIRAIKESPKELELTEMIDYVLSVVFTEAPRILEGTSYTFFDIIDQMNGYIQSTVENPAFPAFLGEDWELIMDSYAEEGEGRLTVIKDTLYAIAGSVRSGGYLVEALDDLFADEEE